MAFISSVDRWDGSLIGGLLIPFLLSFSFYSVVSKSPIHLDTYGTALVTGFIVYLVALTLQPIRSFFDSDKDPTNKLSFSGVTETMRLVTSNPQLRDLSFGAFAFGAFGWVGDQGLALVALLVRLMTAS